MGCTAQRAGSAPGTTPARFVGHHPGELVVLDEPTAIAAAGDEAGWWDPSGRGAIRYDTPPPGAERCIDLERLLAVQHRREAELRAQCSAQGALLAALHDDFRTMIRFVRGITHGAIRSGFAVSTRPRQRHLYVGGGVLSVFAGDRLVNRTVLCEAGVPIKFFLIVGDAAVLAPSGAVVKTSKIPPRLAAAPGGVSGRDGTTEMPLDAWRVDLLAAEPTEDGGVEWCLLLGEAADCKDRGEAAALPTPPVPAWARDGILPIARVTTCGRHTGIASVDVIAPRFNGV